MLINADGAGISQLLSLSLIFRNIGFNLVTLAVFSFCCCYILFKSFNYYQLFIIVVVMFIIIVILLFLILISLLLFFATLFLKFKPC